MKNLHCEDVNLFVSNDVEKRQIEDFEKMQNKNEIKDKQISLILKFLESVHNICEILHLMISAIRKQIF